MSPIESIFPIFAGLVTLAIATEMWPTTQEQRLKLEIRVPIIKNKAVLYSASTFMLLFGISVLFGLIN